MKYIIIIFISFYLFYNIISLKLNIISKNFPLLYIQIGQLENSIPSVLTTETDKLIMVGNPHTYSYMPSKSNTSKKISDDKLSEQYTFVSRTIKFENELYQDNINLTSDLQNISFNFEYVFDNRLSRLLSFPYISFFGIGRSNQEDKYNLNILNQLKNANVIENKRVYFEGQWKKRNIVFGYTENFTYSVKCSYKNLDKRICSVSDLEIEDKVYELNTTVEFIYNNYLYHVFPEKYKKYFDDVLKNKNCVWIRFNHYPMYACENLNNLPDIFLTINEKKINFKYILFGETVKTNPFLKIMFKKDIDYIQLSIPILNEKKIIVIFDDDEENLYLEFPE